MTAAERKMLSRFTTHVNKKLSQIEAHWKFRESLHDFEVSQLKAKLARATRKRKAR